MISSAEFCIKKTDLTKNKMGGFMMMKLRNKRGFTLIEILIVIIVLGILAMIIVPQISVSTEDAKVSTVQSDLSSIRSALEIYYAQHNSKYPGQTESTGGTANTDAGVAAVSMVRQLTQYTNSSGKVSVSKDTTFKYGPYIKGLALPTNPFNEVATVVCDATTDITKTRAATGTDGWKFHFETGVFYAADSTAHAVY